MAHRCGSPPPAGQHRWLAERQVRADHEDRAEPDRQVQSGIVNDYITWIIVGLACLGGVLAFTSR